jgi:hypothetical protein
VAGAPDGEAVTLDPFGVKIFQVKGFRYRPEQNSVPLPARDNST